jgi:hypothetical protein
VNSLQEAEEILRWDEGLHTKLDWLIGRRAVSLFG